MSEVLSNFLIEPSSLNKDEDMIEKSIITYKVIIKKIIQSSILLLSLVEGRPKDDIIYETIINNLKLDLLQNVILKIYKDYAKNINASDDGLVLKISDLNKVR